MTGPWRKPTGTALMVVDDVVDNLPFIVRRDHRIVAAFARKSAAEDWAQGRSYERRKPLYRSHCGRGGDGLSGRRGSAMTALMLLAAFFGGFAGLGGRAAFIASGTSTERCRCVCDASCSSDSCDSYDTSLGGPR